MIDVDKVREEIQGVINEFGMDYYKSNYFELTSQALRELERLQQFKKTFDAYELSQRQGYVAYEILNERTLFHQKIVDTIKMRIDRNISIINEEEKDMETCVAERLRDIDNYCNDLRVENTALEFVLMMLEGEE